jgi:hypothetical protein
VLSRTQRAFGEEDLLARRHGDDHVSGEGLVTARGDADAETCGHSKGTLLIDIPEIDVAAERLQAAGARSSVHARADHGRGTARQAERLGRQRCGSAGAQRGHRACIHHRLDDARLGVREDHDSVHGRQAMRGIAGK